MAKKILKSEQGTEDIEVRDGFKAAFNTRDYLKTHQPAAPICFFGGRGPTDRSLNAVQKVQKLRRDTPEGVTMIRGDSVGGMMALRTASQLFQKGIRLDYLALDAAAFFADLGEIASFRPLQFNVPQPFAATITENFFQVFGHELLIDSRGPGGFMQGAGFHGAIRGFQRNLNTAAFGSNTRSVIAVFNATPGTSNPANVPLAIRKRFADQAHEAAHKDADPRIDSVVKSLIKPDIVSAAILAGASAG